MLTIIDAPGDAAATSVLATPELLSFILIHLNQRTLLTKAQRVCKFWRDEIHASPSLRRSLFFHVPDTGVRSSPQRVLNPLLAGLFPSWFTLDSIEDDTTHESRGIRTREATRHLQKSRVYALRGRDNPFLRRHASWLDMHVSDPPTKLVALHRVGFAKPFKEKSSAHSIYYPDGLRMLHLYLLTLPEGESPHDMVSGFQVLWPAPGERVRREHAASVHHIGRTFPPQIWGNIEKCFQKIESIGAELLVRTSLAYPLIKDDAWSWAMKTMWRECGLRFFQEEFGVEMRPYEHSELMLMDTILPTNQIVIAKDPNA